MNNILQRLKKINKEPPKAWNISTEITQKIIKQNEDLPKIQNEYEKFKKNDQMVKRVSNQIYISNCIQENNQKIQELEKDQADLKEKFNSKINESLKLQDEIKKAKIKKHRIKKENKKLRDSIKELKSAKEDLEKNLDDESPTFENIEEEKSNCELQLKHCNDIIKMINNFKNKRIKVQFVDPPKEKLSKFPKAEYSHRFSRPQIQIKPSFTANQTRERAKSFSEASKHHKKLKSSSGTGSSSSSSQLIELKPIDQEGCITFIQFSKTGRVYATGNENHRFNLYEAGQCMPFESFNLDNSVISIDFNDEESLILVACLNTIYLFDYYYLNGRFRARQRMDKTRTGRIYHAEFVSSDQYIVCIERMPIHLYKVTKRGPKFEEQFSCKVLSTPFWATVTGRGGIAGCYYDGSIRIFDPCSCDEIVANKVHNAPIYQLIFKENTVISLSKDGTVAFTNIITHEIEKRISLKECGIIHNKTRMLIHGNSLLVGGSNGLICEYNINSGKFKRYWDKFHHASITALSDTYYSVISGDQNGIIKIWYDKN